MTVITLQRAPHKERRRRVATKLLAYVSKQMNLLWRDSTREFVRATVDAMGVDTGMARASFLPLAARAKMRGAALKLIGGGRVRPNSYAPLGEPNKRPLTTKSKAAGEKLGQQAFQYELSTPKSLKTLMEFDIVVTQHYLHESTGLWAGGKNWKSLDKGMRAFLEYWDNNLDEYISPKVIATWIVTGEIIDA